MSKNNDDYIGIVIGVGEDTILLSKPLHTRYWFWVHLVLPDGRVFKVVVANIAGSIIEVYSVVDNYGAKFPLKDIPLGTMCAVYYIFDEGYPTQEYLAGKYNWLIRKIMYRFGITEYQLPQKQKKKKK